MSRKRRGQESSEKASRSGLVALTSLVVFGVLATLPITLTALHLHIQPLAPTSSHGVALLPPPLNPAPVSLPPVARPIDPTQGAASLPQVSPAREAALVSAEDSRIRVLLHDAVRVYQPEVLTVRGSLPTLVLTAGAHPYTAKDLVTYGAMVMLPHHAALLLDNLFVSTNAKLDFGTPLQALYLDNSAGGFASIVAWGGSMTFHGTARRPFTIMGWDRVTKSPAVDHGEGRPYIREVGGKMTLTNVRVSALGFWSGRTGGVAWTGVNGLPSTGGATSSTFTDDTYGAFVSRGQGVRFSDDLFEFNQLDGVHIHRYSVNSSVVSSSSSRNGGNGFLVDRATQGTLLLGDVSQNNTGNGVFVDGRPLVNGASASGSAVAPGSGTVVQGTAVIGNTRTGILVEGGSGTVLKADQVCAKITAIAVRSGATNTVVTGDNVRCAPRSGISIGPLASGTTASGNTIVNPRIGMLVRNSGPIRVDNNVVSGATVFGISTRGLTSHVTGVGNLFAGTGFRPVDSRAQAPPPTLSNTNTQAWAHHVNVTFFSYLRFHPLAALWLSILLLVVAAWLWSHRRRLPPHPYPVSTHWRPQFGEPEPSPVAVGALASASAGPSGANPRGLPAHAVATPRGTVAGAVAGAVAAPSVGRPGGPRPPWDTEPGRSEPTRSGPPWQAPPARTPAPPRAPAAVGAHVPPSAAISGDLLGAATDGASVLDGVGARDGEAKLPPPADETKPMPRLTDWP